MIFYFFIFLFDQTKARDILTKNLLVSSNQLRDKYQSLTDEPSNLLRVQETELQVLLRLEMEAVSPTEVTPGKQNTPGDEDGAGMEEDERRRGESSEDEGPVLPENVQELVDEVSQLLDLSLYAFSKWLGMPGNDLIKIK